MAVSRQIGRGYWQTYNIMYRIHEGETDEEIAEWLQERVGESMRCVQNDPDVYILDDDEPTPEFSIEPSKTAAAAASPDSARKRRNDEAAPATKKPKTAAAVAPQEQDCFAMVASVLASTKSLANARIFAERMLANDAASLKLLEDKAEINKMANVVLEGAELQRMATLRTRVTEWQNMLM